MELKARRLLTLGVLSTLLVLVAASPPVAGPEGPLLEPVVPILSCVTYTEHARTLIGVLGYLNPNSVEVGLPLGPLNFFDPSPSDRGQPTEFQPGFHPREFYILFNPNLFPAVDWMLDGSKVTVADDSDHYCHPATLALAVSGTGTISATPEVSACTDACSAVVDVPVVRQLSAVPEPGWSFAGYAGDDDCLDGEVALDAGDLVSCVAVFDPPVEPTLAVVVFGDGIVESDVGGIVCPPGPCVAAVEDGSIVSLTAYPGLGSDFLGWGGDPDCADGELTMSAHRVCTATFSSTAIFVDGFESGDTSAWAQP